MNLLWSITDYFMDFHKVRKFQEICGIKECDASIRQDEAELSKKIVSNERQHVDHCIDESSAQEKFIEFEPNSKHNNMNYHKDSSNDKVNSDLSDDLLEKRTYQITNWFLYYMFRFGSTLGHEIFYISFIPFIFWNIDPFIARKMVVVWVVTM